jgi:hypothetical protein
MFKARLRLLARVLLSPPVIVFVASLVLIFFCLLQTYRIRPFSSDDVAWQRQLMTWRPFDGHTAAQGSTAPFVDKLPLFIPISHFFKPSRHILFAESYTTEALGFTLLYLSGLYFLRRQNSKLNYWNLLPFIWLASFGFNYVELFMNSNWRGFDIGVTFVSFVAAAILLQVKYRTKPLPKFIWWILPIIAFIGGVMVYSDPHYLYFTVVPLFVFSIWVAYKRLINRVQFFTLLGTLVTALVFAKIVNMASMAAGIKIMAVYPVQFIDFDHFFSNIASTIHSILIIFGADFFGNSLITSGSISALVNFIVVVIISVCIYRLCKTYIRGKFSDTSLPSLWLVFFSFIILECIALFAFSTLSSYNTYRYFVVVVFASIIILALKMGTTRPRVQYGVAAVLIIATLGNITIAIRRSATYAFVTTSSIISTNEANALNYSIDHQIESTQTYKGYANYWQANIDTYLSGGRVNMLPVLCTGDNKTINFDWLVDQSRFQVSAAKSFYLYDPGLPQPPTCTVPQVEQQFGAPERVIKISDKTLLLYNYDIGTRMAPAP